MPERERDKPSSVTVFTGVTDRGAEFAQMTLESYSQVGVSARVPELHMLVRPPRDALFYQRNFISGAIGIDVVQHQSV